MSASAVTHRSIYEEAEQSPEVAQQLLERSLSQPVYYINRGFEDGIRDPIGFVDSFLNSKQFVLAFFRKQYHVETQAWPEEEMLRLPGHMAKIIMTISPETLDKINIAYERLRTGVEAKFQEIQKELTSDSEASDQAAKAGKDFASSLNDNDLTSYELGVEKVALIQSCTSINDVVERIIPQIAKFSAPIQEEGGGSALDFEQINQKAYSVLSFFMATIKQINILQRTQ